jgi:hypothetical protein
MKIADEKRAKIEAKKARRAEREAELGRRQREHEPGKFGAILADTESGRDDIVSIATKDCVLIVRCTGPTLLRPLALMQDSGFKYKSEFVRVVAVSAAANVASGRKILRDLQAIKYSP